jgi:hypothetical protein
MTMKYQEEMVLIVLGVQEKKEISLSMASGNILGIRDCVELDMKFFSSMRNLSIVKGSMSHGEISKGKV